MLFEITPVYNYGDGKGEQLAKPFIVNTDDVIALRVWNAPQSPAKAIITVGTHFTGSQKDDTYYTAEDAETLAAKFGFKSVARFINNNDGKGEQLVAPVYVKTDNVTFIYPYSAPDSLAKTRVQGVTIDETGRQDWEIYTKEDRQVICAKFGFMQVIPIVNNGGGRGEEFGVMEYINKSMVANVAAFDNPTSRANAYVDVIGTVNGRRKDRRIFTMEKYADLAAQLTGRADAETVTAANAARPMDHPQAPSAAKSQPTQ